MSRKTEIESKDKAYTLIRTADQFVVLSTRDDKDSITCANHVKNSDRLQMAAALVLAAINMLPTDDPIEQLKALINIYAQHVETNTNLH